MISPQEKIIGRAVRDALHLPSPFDSRSALLLEPDLLQGHAPPEAGPSPEVHEPDARLNGDIPVL